MGRRRRRRHRHRRRRHHDGEGQPPLEEAANHSLAHHESEALGPSPPDPDEEPFLGAVLDDYGEIRYRLRTRQRVGAKYLLREVYD